MSGKNFIVETCIHCGGLHSTTCPRIKALEYFENGGIKRIEFHGPQQPMAAGTAGTLGPVATPRAGATS